MITIKNFPDVHKKYVVARQVIAAKGEQPEYYFWASFDTEEEAYPAAERYAGQVFIREEKK